MPCVLGKPQAQNDKHELYAPALKVDQTLGDTSCSLPEHLYDSQPCIPVPALGCCLKASPRTLLCAGTTEGAESAASTAEKQLRTIQKKLRQCEALQVRLVAARLEKLECPSKLIHNACRFHAGEMPTESCACQRACNPET